MDPKQIAAALGLPETATAEQCLQAIKDLVAGNADLNKKVDEMNKSACANEADAVIAANKDRIADPVAFKQLFCANKDFALKALAATKVPEKTTTVANKTEGKRPDIATGGGVAENKLTAYRAMKPGKEKDAFLAANKAELVVLENAARDAASGK